VAADAAAAAARRSVTPSVRSAAGVISRQSCRSGKAQRESARRRKSDWGKISGGEVKFPW